MARIVSWEDFPSKECRPFEFAPGHEHLALDDERPAVKAWAVQFRTGTCVWFATPGEANHFLDILVQNNLTADERQRPLS